MRKMTKREKTGITIISILTGIMTIIVAFIRYGHNPITRDNLIFSGLIIAFTFPAAVDYVEYKWRKSVEERFPDFLREMAERLRSGMPFYKALEAATERNYGPLTPELKKLIHQISWGQPPEKAFDIFAQRIGTPLAKRVSILLLEVGRMGAETAKVLDTISEFLRSLQMMERERIAELRVHMLTIYSSFTAFMIVSIILITNFFYPLYISTSIYGGPIQPLLTPIEARQILLHMLAIEAVTGGLMAGKMAERRISAGLKHAIILLTVSLILFNYFVKPLT